MAIDPKELRIGSHVEYDGRRCIVVGLADIGSAPKSDIALKCEDEVMLNADINSINPIPITEELLSELGFEKAPFKSYRRDLGESEPFMHFHCIADGCWRMDVSDDTRNYGNIVCEYLHQAEAFLSLTTKNELISN